jgi:hypothetical protein
MTAQRHPQVQWIVWQRTTQGFAARCQACGASATAGTPEGVDAFAAAHQEHRSASPGHYGAGDLVARATKALGMETCSPCEARRQALNQRFPRFWPRRG